jgi:DNA-binding CsgD family transcriptional regulator
MLQVSRNVQEYVQYIATASSIDSVDIFCYDSTSGKGDVFDLYAYGLDSQIKALYKKERIFESDPFTDMFMRESFSSEEHSFAIANDPRHSAVRERVEKYWRFTHTHNVEVVGAASRRFLPGFYLVVGMHRAATRVPRGDVPIELLKRRIAKLTDTISVDILQMLLREHDGYARLRQVMTGAPTNDIAMTNRLSPREADVARLICLGKQNKEVAYVTGLTEHSVENTLRRIYRKLKIHNRAALVSKMSGTS